MIDTEKRAYKQQAKDKVRKRMNVQVDMDNYEYIPAKKPIDYYDSETPQNVGIYVRVSTDDIRQTTSYELQKKYYEDFVSRHSRHSNWTLIDIYADVYNQRLIPFDTKKAVQTLKITAFEGKNACRKPLFLFFETLMPACRVQQCTQQIRGGCICTQAK